MVAESIIIKAADGAQALQFSAMTGKTFAVNKVVNSGTGLLKWVVLVPKGGAGAAGGSAMVVKLDSARQAAEVSGLVGKTVTVGKIPTLVGGANSHWVLLQPVGGAGAAGAAGAAKSVAGKSVAAKSAVVGNKSVVGKSVAAKSAVAGKSIAAKSGLGGAAAAAAGKSVGGKFLLAQAAANGGPAVGGATLAGMAIPLLAGGAAAAVIYGLYWYFTRNKDLEDNDEDVLDAEGIA